MATVLVPLAQGFEELEAITIIDLLRRADIEVITAGLQAGPVTAANGVVVLPDASLDEVVDLDFDMVVLPGGQPGSDHLNSDPRIITMLKKTAEAGNFTAAICAAPKVLATAGLLENKEATCYPGSIDLVAIPGIEYLNQPVVSSGKVVTSRGPGTAMDFGLTLIEKLLGAEARARVEEPLLRP